MLLSLPTWLIHLLTVTEWLAAILLLHRYGTLIGRSELRLLGYAMVPHLIGGLCILRFHLGGDTEPGWIDAARVFSFGGSLALAAATLCMLVADRDRAPCWPWLLLPLGLAGALALGFAADEPSALILRAANLGYLLFLVNLLLIHRRDPRLLPLLSIAGFWFLLVFVAMTIAATHVAVVAQGLPSLSHHDLLHGLSESLLTLGNSMIVLGLWLRLGRMRQAGSQAPAADRSSGCAVPTVRGPSPQISRGTSPTRSCGNRFRTSRTAYRARSTRSAPRSG